MNCSTSTVKHLLNRTGTISRRCERLLIFRLVAACALSFAANVPRASAQDFIFAYVAPVDTMTAHFDPGDLVSATFKLASGEKVLIIPGYRLVNLETEEQTSTFRAIAPPNLLATYDSLTTDSALRATALSLRQISGDVEIINGVELIDDRTGLTEESAYYPTDLDSTTGRWFILPGTRTWQTEIDGKNFFASVIHTPERMAGLIRGEPGGVRKWEAWIVHQITHTQFLPDPSYGMNMWGDARLGLGPARPRWKGDLLDDRQTALLEGLAGFWEAMYSDDEGRKLIDFCNRVRPRFRVGTSFRLAAIPEVWDAPHDVDTTGQVDSAVAGSIFDQASADSSKISAAFRFYSWRNLPGTYVLHNEMMNTAFFYLFWKFGMADRDVALSYIFAATSQIAAPEARNRYLAYAANLIANSVEEHASMGGPGKEATLRSSMFVYALYDLVTHFGMPESALRERFQANFPPTHPKAFDRYWTHRAKAQELAEPHINGFIYDIDQAALELVKYFSQPEMIIR